MLRKRSVTINGHGTSYSIEDEFHDELARLARAEGKPVARLIASIDASRPEGANLSSAIRLYVLGALRDGR
ncbi:MAG: ribbon-helix-helix domain-containing protein [Nitratireductor sp.]|jgi:predicted DNA-binding ribbon-helix-helix protein|nr:ribbon-helix-helix domain-containing protein [Nitratireductor sp.]